jgi:hypothetical protein
MNSPLPVPSRPKNFRHGSYLLMRHLSEGGRRKSLIQEWSHWQMPVDLAAKSQVLSRSGSEADSASEEAIIVQIYFNDSQLLLNQCKCGWRSFTRLLFSIMFTMKKAREWVCMLCVNMWSKYYNVGPRS